MNNDSTTMEHDYYYIARRLNRFSKKPYYIGDGMVTAVSVKEAREVVASRYGCPKKYIKLKKKKAKVS